MNSVALALKNSGIKLPTLSKRVWVWLKDHPGKNSAEVSAALSVPRGHVSPTLSSLEARGMVSYTQDFRGKGRAVKSYSVIGKDYTLLPRLMKDSPCKTHATRVEIDAPIIRIEPKPVGKIGIEQLPLSEAWALYRKLKEFFTN